MTARCFPTLTVHVIIAIGRGFKKTKHHWAMNKIKSVIGTLDTIDCGHQILTKNKKSFLHCATSHTDISISCISGKSLCKIWQFETVSSDMMHNMMTWHTWHDTWWHDLHDMTHDDMIYITWHDLHDQQTALTTCCVVEVKGRPRIRMIVCPPRDRKACASELLPFWRKRNVIIECICVFWVIDIPYF